MVDGAIAGRMGEFDGVSTVAVMSRIVNVRRGNSYRQKCFRNSRFLAKRQSALRKMPEWTRLTTS